MSVRAFLLLGGLVGPDGWLDSIGMLAIAHQLSQLGVPCQTYTWDNYVHCAEDMQRASGAKRVLIGFSGGASRATYLNRQFPRLGIDLLVGYDPSPKWEVLALTDAVAHAVCYHNQHPLLGDLGGGQFTALKGQSLLKIETIEIAEEHLAVQYDQSLHAKTVELVKALL